MIDLLLYSTLTLNILKYYNYGTSNLNKNTQINQNNQIKQFKKQKESRPVIIWKEDKR